MTTQYANLTPEQKARRKEREKERQRRKAAEIKALIDQLPPVECECGCGTLIPALTTGGKPRRYADSHGGRTAKFRRPGANAWETFDFPVFDAEPACASEDPETFWSFDADVTAVAKAICLGCPAREQCLAWALERDEDEGVWGGLTGKERRAWRHGLTDVASLAHAALEDAAVRKLTHQQTGAAIAWLTQRGETAEQIAARLGMSQRTVHRWRTRLKEAQAA